MHLFRADSGSAGFCRTHWLTHRRWFYSLSQPLDSVRNLGSWFESNMCMSIHIGKICNKAFHGLYKIRQIRKFLSPESTKTLVHAYVTSHLDYCNSLLFRVPKYQTDRLQKVFKAAARLIFRIPKFDHISSALSHLHWLVTSCDLSRSF